MLSWRPTRSTWWRTYHAAWLAKWTSRNSRRWPSISWDWLRQVTRLDHLSGRALSDRTRNPVFIQNLSVTSNLIQISDEANRSTDQVVVSIKSQNETEKSLMSRWVGSRKPDERLRACLRVTTPQNSNGNHNHHHNNDNKKLSSQTWTSRWWYGNAAASGSPLYRSLVSGRASGKETTRSEPPHQLKLRLLLLLFFLCV